jgi:Holliday junction resolvase-like predicted endonuclease
LLLTRFQLFVACICRFLQIIEGNVLQRVGETDIILCRTIYLLSSLARQQILRPPQGGLSVERAKVHRIHGRCR